MHLTDVILCPSVYTHSFSDQGTEALCYVSQKEEATATATATVTVSFQRLYFSSLLCFFQFLQDFAQQVLASDVGNNFAIPCTPPALQSKSN